MTSKRLTLLAIVALVAGQAAAALYETNLLQNGGAEAGDMSGWTLLETGGNNWALDWHTAYSGDHCFSTSHQWNTRYQEIDLLTAGFSEAVLDASPDIEISEWFATRGDSGGEYYLTVELRDSSHQVIDSWTTGTQTLASGVDWFAESHSFSDYGAGIRYVYFEDGGKDTSSWGGNYGTSLDEASVQVVPEPATISLIGLFGIGLFIVRRRWMV